MYFTFAISKCHQPFKSYRADTSYNVLPWTLTWPRRCWWHFANQRIYPAYIFMTRVAFEQNINVDQFPVWHVRGVFSPVDKIWIKCRLVFGFDRSRFVHVFKRLPVKTAPVQNGRTFGQNGPNSRLKRPHNVKLVGQNGPKQKIQCCIMWIFNKS